MKTYSFTGIILKKNSYGESDKLLKIISPSFGIHTFLAKGARKPGNKLSALSEKYSVVDCTAHEGNSWDYLNEISQNNQFVLRERSHDELIILDNIASYLLRMGEYEQLSEALFNEFTLVLCDTDLYRTSLWFYIRLLMHQGVLPVVDLKKLQDQNKKHENSTLVFDMNDYEFSYTEHVRTYDQLPILENTIKIIRIYSESPTTPKIAGKFSLPELQKIIDILMQHYLK
jgi:DNA repair protein RecO